MRTGFTSIIVAAHLVLAGCASIPAEAPELSAQLGTRISSLEAAHVRLLREFFVEKRRKVDEFVQQVWVPTFAKEFFNDPTIDNMWNQVVHSDDPTDRVTFITIVGPKLQAKINRKRVELIQPLDDLESNIINKLKTEYDQTKAINNTLTSFLQSASEVEENRKRYLDMIGVTDKTTDQFVGETDQAVSELLSSTRNIQDKAKDIEKYRKKINSILDNFKE